MSINHYVEQVLPLKARSRLWFLWTELQLKLAMSEMDLEGLWKHTLQHLLLSVMFCFGACCVGLCFVTQLSVRYVFVMVLAVFVTSLVLSVQFFSAIPFFFTFSVLSMCSFFLYTSSLGFQIVSFFQGYIKRK